MYIIGDHLSKITPESENQILILYIDLGCLIVYAIDES